MQHIGLGTAAIGRPQYINIKQEVLPFDPQRFIKDGVDVLDTAYKLGIRYFDTAPGYGLAEQLLMDWLKDKSDSSIEVATKWGYTYLANFDLDAAIHERKDHSLEQLNRQWNISRQLLPYLSTLQIHSATFDTGVLSNKSVLLRLAELKMENNILIGLTTTGDNQVEVVKRALDITLEDTPLFDVFQVTYNILDQSLLSVSDEMIRSGKRIVIKEALANGRIFRNANYSQYGLMYDTLEKLAKKYEVGVDAVALRLCLDAIGPFMVLSGADSAIQVKENLKTNEFKLEEDEIRTLRSFSAEPKIYWNERAALGWN